MDTSDWSRVQSELAILAFETAETNEGSTIIASFAIITVRRVVGHHLTCSSTSNAQRAADHDTQLECSTLFRDSRDGDALRRTVLFLAV